MNGDNFKEWFESFLPRLDPNSIVVMDNAPYHSVQAEKYPSASWIKSEILEWLYSKGVVLDRPMLKAQLVVKVRELKKREKSYIMTIWQKTQDTPYSDHHRTIANSIQ